MASDGIWGEIILIGLGMVLHGVCGAAEVALFVAQKSRLRECQENGKRGAAAALLIRDMPQHFLLTVQIVMTGVGMFTAALAGVVAVRDIAPWMVYRWSLTGMPWWVIPLALTVVVGGLTYVALLLGRLFPRAIALQHAEAVLCWVAPSLLRLARVSGVMRGLFSGSLTVLLWLSRQSRPPELASMAVITEEDVTTMVREGAERGIFEEVEHELIEGVFEFTDTAAREIMVPRVHIQALDVTMPEQEVVRKMGEIGHSRVPVYRGDLDHVVGVLYFKDVLRAISEGRAWTLRALLHPPLFVPETVQLSHLLRTLQQQRLRMAIVVDEHGGVAGLVTIQDLLEELVGEIADEDEPIPDAQVVQLPDGSLVILGGAPLWELRERFGLPVEASSDYQTLAGLLLARLGRVPQGGESITEQGYRFIVVDMDGPRIARIKVEPYEAEATEAETVETPPDDADARKENCGNA